MCVRWVYIQLAKRATRFMIKPLIKEIHVSRDVIFFEERFPFKRGEIECSKGWEELQNMAWDDDMVGLTQHGHDVEEESDHATELQEGQSEENVTREQEQRHSGRVQQLPTHLKDYEVNLPPSIAYPSPNPPTGNSVMHPLSNHISYNKFSHSHSAFLM